MLIMAKQAWSGLICRVAASSNKQRSALNTNENRQPISVYLEQVAWYCQYELQQNRKLSYVDLICDYTYLGQ